MATFKDELMTILERQLYILKDLKKITSKKTDIIMNDKVDELKKMTIKEEDFINKMAVLEMEREYLFDSWGIEKGTPLSNIIKDIPGEKEDLKILGNRLFIILKSIDEENKLNDILIKDSIDWIEFNLNLVTDTEVPSTYGNKNKKVKVNNNFFDRKV